MTVTIALHFRRHRSKVFNGWASNPLEPLKSGGILNTMGSLIRSVVSETTYNSPCNAYKGSKTAENKGLQGCGFALLSRFLNQVS